MGYGPRLTLFLLLSGQGGSGRGRYRQDFPGISTEEKACAGAEVSSFVIVEVCIEAGKSSRVVNRRRSFHSYTNRDYYDSW